MGDRRRLNKWEMGDRGQQKREMGDRDQKNREMGDRAKTIGRWEIGAKKGSWEMSPQNNGKWERKCLCHPPPPPSG